MNSCSLFFFFLMIRRPPRSTLDRSSAASDVYKRQVWSYGEIGGSINQANNVLLSQEEGIETDTAAAIIPVSYTHLRAHETVLDLVCRLLLEKKKTNINISVS